MDSAFNTISKEYLLYISVNNYKGKMAKNWIVYEILKNYLKMKLRF